MSRTDVMSFSVNFTLPPEIIKEYFDGLAKVESSKKSSSDYSILYALAPLFLNQLSSYNNKTDDNLSKLINKMKEEKKESKEESKEEKKDDIKNDRDNMDIASILNTVKSIMTGFGCEQDLTDKAISLVSSQISGEVKKDDDIKNDDIKTNDDIKNDDIKTNDVKPEEVKSEKVYTDCYEELADLLNTDKRASDLLSKIKKDGNMFKLMQIVNGAATGVANVTTSQTVEVVNVQKAEIVNEPKLEAAPELKAEVATESKSEVPVNPLAGLATMFTGGQGGQGLNDMMKSFGQTNNPAIDNMMKSFGPVMEGLMGGNFANASVPTTSTSTTTSTTSTTQKKSRPKTTSEILQELEKSDEVD